MVSWHFRECYHDLFFPCGLRPLFQTSRLPKELPSSRPVPTLVSPLPISCSGFTTSAPALPHSSSLSISEYIWCALNLFWLIQTPANATVKLLYGSAMPCNLPTLLPSVSHHSLLCPFHLSIWPPVSCFSLPILRNLQNFSCNSPARLICLLQRCFLLFLFCCPPSKQLSFSNLTGINACNMSWFSAVLIFLFKLFYAPAPSFSSHH